MTGLTVLQQEAPAIAGASCCLVHLVPVHLQPIVAHTGEDLYRERFNPSIDIISFTNKEEGMLHLLHPLLGHRS